MARRKSTRKQKKSITSYIFLIIGVVIVIVVAGSWFAFPDWHAQPGGFWTLLGVAALGVVAITKDVVEILKSIREMENKTNSSKRDSGTVSENNKPIVTDNIQHGEKNKIQVDLNNADVSRNRQIGTGNEISVGSSKPRRDRRS